MAPSPPPDWPVGRFGALLVDPPWRFEAWSELGEDRAPDYPTMTLDEIAKLPVGSLAADNCLLVNWIIWPLLPHALKIMAGWGFKYKTCAFSWMKADVKQFDLFGDSPPVSIGPGYWTRSNSEVALLATKGQPKRLNADVRQGIIEPRREHSRKPDATHGRIERLVAGPYCELFARQRRPGWTTWGNQQDRFPPLEGATGIV